MKKLLRAIWRFSIYLFIIVIGILLMYYLLAPVYKFSGPVPFSGNKLYNPYQSIDSSEWRKYNFQVQSKAWLGITDGRKNSNELIDSIYKRLGYDHVSTSDYQKINTFGINNPAYIPTYEHGYNIFKTHQVCIDTDKVLWIDLMFGQTLSMKQWILDKLSEHAKIVALAHPVLRDGYSLNDMKYLTNYDAIEVLNNMRVSVEHWDAALSSGQIAYIISNDDAHDVMNTNHVGRRFTMINSPTLNREIIVSNLKKGAAYGMDFFRIGDEPFEDKIERSLHIPKLTSAILYTDTLVVKVNAKALQFRFIGNDGKVLKIENNTNTSSYIIDGKDRYVRTEIIFPDSSIMYLNPIIRYSGEFPLTFKTAEVDSSATMKLRIVYFLIVLSIAYLISRFRMRKKRN
jgi:hypothetical protein|tara:strand:+ start:1133 stop:2332 length:1200 start_codon:yes stop_codon:yes gene_type:complete